MESINNLNIMKGNKMFKKINNHGFGLVPILVLSLFVGVLGVFTYNYYSSNEVLSMKGVGSLSQRPGDGEYTFPPKLPQGIINATLDFNGTPNTYQTGQLKIEVSITSDEDIVYLRNSLRMNGLEIEEYCMTAICPKPRIVKPVVTLGCKNSVPSCSPKDTVLTILIPVTPNVKSVSYVNTKGYDYEKLPKFKFDNKLTNWEVELFKDEKLFSIRRKNEKANVRVTLLSVNNNTGQMNLEFLINGIGNDSAALIRSIRMNGVRRIDKRGDFPSTITLRPNVSVSQGQGKFNMQALKNTSTIYFALGNLKVEFLPILSGWSVNKNGDGIDRVVLGLPPRISITEVKLAGGVESNFNFIVRADNKSDMNTILSTIKDSGVTVTRCIGDQKCYYPVQKPNVVCGDYVTVGCRFSVRVPNDAQYIYFNYRNNYINSAIQQTPRNWVPNGNGDGINKKIN